MKKLLLFFILSSCATTPTSINISDDDFDFEKDISIFDYKKKNLINIIKIIHILKLTKIYDKKC